MIKMLKKKNVVEKFNEFVSRLNNKEKQQLYDLLCMMRGPDYDDEDYPNVKYEFTARVRYILGFNNIYLGAINPTDFPKRSVLLQMLKEHEINTGFIHYTSHVRYIINNLTNLGIIKK